MIQACAFWEQHPSVLLILFIFFQADWQLVLGHVSDTENPQWTNTCTSAKQFKKKSYFINFQPVKLFKYRGNVIIFSNFCDKLGGVLIIH